MQSHQAVTHHADLKLVEYKIKQKFHLTYTSCLVKVSIHHAIISSIKSKNDYFATFEEVNHIYVAC